MKLKLLTIPPEDLAREITAAEAAEAAARENYERAKELNDTKRMFELLNILEVTHIRAFRLKNITPERLAFERQRAADEIITTYRRHLETRDDEEISATIESFRAWSKALIVAKELSIEITTDDFSMQAAALIDAVLDEALKNKDDQSKMNTWYKLYANVMYTLSRLQVHESEISRIHLFGTRMLKPFGG